MLDSSLISERSRRWVGWSASWATKPEAGEILPEAEGFFELVEIWIVAHHPKLCREGQTQIGCSPRRCPSPLGKRKTYFPRPAICITIM